MSEAYLVQQPIQIWNPVRGVWEKPMASLLCEHWELFSEAWQTSGMMRNGQVFALPMPAHLTADSEYSSQQQGLMPTPNTMEHLPAREGEARERQLHRGGSNSRRASSGNLREDILEVANLPTPTTRDYKDGTAEHERDGVVQTDTVARAIFNSGEILLPTTRVSMAHGATSKEIEAGNPKSRIETEVMLGSISWGKFEPAIRRWEAVMNRPAPAPTLPDGKDGAHRLSPWFTEWMMGLPEGWICNPEIGLTRNEMLKACGNGVVPQQAQLALRILLEGIDFTESESLVNLPTPTVMDQRDGRYFRTVAIKNLEKGMNRGLNLNNIVEAIGVNWQDGDTFTMTDEGLKKNDN